MILVCGVTLSLIMINKKCFTLLVSDIERMNLRNVQCNLKKVTYLTQRRYYGLKFK